ncbi:hypothetical protein IEN85_00635 [Pelagicoccus sp. NFK12]|uniref:Uncharacterized protein n=1 Tax=Pelagicoccus enzymogenes TaxID=2773457 RepID=A0A927F405_9BACT|nr:hypothetical protein [Pelagicoccus enzymogenes]MBD5777999.1 hypothetical protein [Pelagicoccus enzymogenes]MDQ8197944.1 hypothetical protein [Pelagicoccus enzymogenes]
MKKKTVSERGTGQGSESPPPPYNTNLDPDNATSPLEFDERIEEGKVHFFPEGGPEEPPVRNFTKEYGLKIDTA